MDRIVSNLVLPFPSMTWTRVPRATAPTCAVRPACGGAQSRASSECFACDVGSWLMQKPALQRVKSTKALGQVNLRTSSCLPQRKPAPLEPAVTTHSLSIGFENRAKSTWEEGGPTADKRRFKRIALILSQKISVHLLNQRSSAFRSCFPRKISVNQPDQRSSAFRPSLPQRPPRSSAFYSEVQWDRLI
jgi:hypothetical protein